MKKLTLGQRRLTAWAGLIGSALFVAVFTIEGAIRPGYEWLSTYISALSLGPRGWIQMTNFFILGLLLLAFTGGVAAEFREEAPKAGPILLAIISILFIVSGPFVMDPTGTPLGQVTVHGTIHGLAGGIIFILMPISCFVFLRRFRTDPAWHSLSGWTLVLGIVIAAAVLVLTATSKSPALLSATSGWQGLIQRFIVVPFMLWIFIFALGLLRQTKQS